MKTLHRSPRRLCAIIASAGLTAGALLACAGAEPGPEVGRPSTPRVGAAPGSTTTVVAQSAERFAQQRDRFVKRMVRKLADLDEQIEMLDEMLLGRVEQTETDSTIAMTSARATLEHQRVMATDALNRARAATEERWPEHEVQTRLEVERVETTYQDAVDHLYH